LQLLKIAQCTYPTYTRSASRLARSFTCITAAESAAPHVLWPSMSHDIVLDRDVRDWVLVPLTASIFLMMLIRQYATQARCRPCGALAVVVAERPWCAALRLRFGRRLWQACLRLCSLCEAADAHGVRRAQRDAANTCAVGSARRRSWGARRPPRRS